MNEVVQMGRKRTKSRFSSGWESNQGPPEWQPSVRTPTPCQINCLGFQKIEIANFAAKFARISYFTIRYLQ
jgi:hypothetical protein